MGIISIVRRLFRPLVSLMLPFALVIFLLGSQPVNAKVYSDLNSSTVVQIQKSLMSLGYLSGSADGIFGKKTLSALVAFQRDSGLKPDGIYGSKTKSALSAAVQSLGKRTYTVSKGDSLWLIARRFKTTPEEIARANSISVNKTLKIGQSLTIPSGKTAISRGIISGSRVSGAMSWGSVNPMFKVKSWARITDVKTGSSFQVVRKGGSLHADVEPATQADTDIMKKIYGGSWSWERRAVIVSLSGVLIAASINGMPHGVGSIQNNGFPGHFCVHFLGSRIHRTRALDADHQAMVRYASEHMRQ